MNRAQKALWRVAAVGALLALGSFGSCVAVWRSDPHHGPDNPAIGVLFWITLLGVGVILLAGAVSGTLLLVERFRKPGP